MDDRNYNDESEGYQHKRHRRAYRQDVATVQHEQQQQHRANDDHQNRQQNNQHGTSWSTVVAQHYNNMNNNDISQRQNSKIYFMRNFNNWIKSIIIRDTITYLRTGNEDAQDNPRSSFVVLDLGCGKGGDLIKFQKSRITHLVCADIASISIGHCKDRFNSMSNISYTAEFISIDCSREPILNQLKDPELQYDMTSCQFSFHYCFETYEQVRMMVRNASENLKIGGIFCGTIPDSTEIMKRLKVCGTNTFGNDVYSIKFPKSYEETIKDGVPLFGARYEFHLTEVVDCPEFLVHFPVFEEICRSFGLELLLKKRFDVFFNENKGDEANAQLMNYMDALEKYPPRDGESLISRPENYSHIREFVFNYNGRPPSTMGTLSKSEWEAVTLYLVFSFRKISNGPI